MVMPEAKIAICKCPETHKSYGVRFEKTESGTWKYTWAFPIKESTARRKGYDSTIIEGAIEPSPDYPGCPYCGAKHFVICACGKLNCNVGMRVFKCEWCGIQSMEFSDYTGSGFFGGGDR